MRFSTTLLGGLVLALAATPALAQDDTAPPPALKLTGNTTLVSDYRFRGLTQTDEEPALQTTINLNHKSGFYVGTFMSEIDGSGGTPALTGYGGAEVDLYGGFTKTLSNGLGVDVGLLYYYYPGGRKNQNTDFFEPYGSLTYAIGPVAAKAGVAYAWGGQKGLDFTSGNDDDIYGFLEGSVGVPGTPLTLKAHGGYTNGSLGLVNPTADDTYYDWSLTAEAVGGPLKVGVSYIDTDISNRRIAGVGRFADQLGRGSTVVGYVGLTF